MYLGRINKYVTVREMPGFCNKVIDRFHKWLPKKYSFVFVLIRKTSLVLKEHFFCILSVQTRLVRLISTKTTEYFFWPPFMQSSIAMLFFLWEEVTGSQPTTNAEAHKIGIIFIITLGPHPTAPI